MNKFNISDYVLDRFEDTYDFLFERKTEYDNKIHESEVLNPVRTSNPYGNAYSLKRKQDIELNQFDFNKHFVVVGKTGHGKNVAIDNLIQMKIQKGDSVIFIDPKGDPAAMNNFETLCRFHKRKYHILSEFRGSIRGGNPIFNGDVQSIVERIFNMFDWDNPYYRDQNFTALKNTIVYIKEHKLPMCLNEIQRVFKERFLNKETTDLLSKLDQINTSVYSFMVNDTTSPLTVDYIRKENACLYVSLSTLGHSKISRQIGKLFMQEVMYHCYQEYKSRSSKNSLYVVFDEFGSIAVPTAAELIDKSRGAGVSLCLSFQAFSNLRKLGDVFADNILSNVDNFLFGHTNVPDHAEEMAKFIGTRESTNLTRQTEDSAETGLGSIRDVREYYAHPDIFKKLQIGQFVTLSKQPHFCVDLIKFYLVDFIEMNRELRINNSKNTQQIIDFEKQEMSTETVASDLLELLNSVAHNSEKQEARTSFTLSKEQ